MQFIIGGVQKTSLLDFPDKISAIVFTKGCNFKCGYCHNPQLLKSGDGIYDVDAFFDFLKKRQGKIDGVVVTGGEATLQTDLKLFIQKVKELGFLVKLDTNGTNPKILKELIQENLLDYIAMDIKAPLEKYSLIANTSIDISSIVESIEIIMSSNVDYEFRTTILPSLISKDDFDSIGNLIQGAKRYYLQKFVVQSYILDSSLKDEKNYTDAELTTIKEKLKKYIQFIDIR